MMAHIGFPKLSTGPGPNPKPYYLGCMEVTGRDCDRRPTRRQLISSLTSAHVGDACPRRKQRGFPKFRAAIWGAPIIRIVLLGGLCSVPLSGKLPNLVPFRHTSDATYLQAVPIACSS